MTFSVTFFAEQAYLSFVKDYFDNPPDEHEKAVERGAVCVIALACGLEAILNQILRNHSNIRHWDDFRYVSKVETACDIADVELDWGREPFQSISNLIALRNWLVHYKNPEIGLINSDGDYLESDYWKIPKRSPDTELIPKNIQRLYDHVREYLISISSGLNLDHEFDYLESQDYYAFLVG